MRILIADDSDVVRRGVCGILSSEKEFEVCGEARDGSEALQKARELLPDLILLDVSMPGLNGLEATSRIVKEFPRTRVIILSMHASEDHVLLALHKGASGYLLKGARLTELDLAVRSVARGEVYLSEVVSKHIRDNYMRQAGEPKAAAVGEPLSIERLTARQREVLQLIAEGHSVKQVAVMLGISVKTAETHRAQIMERLHIHDLAGLVRYAIRIGMIAPGE